MNPYFSDADLVRRAQAGHLQAFEVLVERHQLRIYRVALRMLGNPADAQDVAQDAFLRAWRALAGFRGDSAFSTWLYRIVTNQCLKFLRDRPRAAPLDELAEAPASRPEELVEAGARRQALADAIAKLNPNQRAALVLREFEGCTYEEVAAILGITVAAVKGRLHRARLELLEVMREWS